MNTTIDVFEPKVLLPITWKPELILISYIVSVQSCYAAVLILQLKFSKFLLVVGSLCLSVSGIWSMHFIGMAAMEIDTHVDYNIGWTIASAVFAFVLTTIAFSLVDNHTKCTVSSDVPLTLESHIVALKGAPHLWIFVSAVLIATGVCTMHYTGMHAIESQASTEKAWGVILVSVLIALFASVASLYFAFVLPITRRFTIPTALVMGVAVCGMHYSGMYGVNFYLEESLRTKPSSTISDSRVVSYIICGSTILSSAALALSSYLYRVNLRIAAERANTFADMIIQGRYEVLTDGVITSKDPIMNEIYEAFRDMGVQLQKLKSFLPQSLLAAYEDGDQSLSEEDDGISTIIVSADGSFNDYKTRRTGTLRDISLSEKSRSSIDADTDVSSKRITVLVFNLIGFHKLVNSRRFEEILQIQTQTLETLVVISQQYKSIIDNYQGDRAVLTFNAASSNLSHIKKSGLCAVDITNRISQLHKLPSTIGIASGTAIVGVMGTSTMRRHGIISAAYSQACILERMCKCYEKVPTLVGPECRLEMRIELKLQCVDYVQLPGKSKACIISQLIDVLNQTSDHEWMYALQSYERKAHDETNVMFDLYLEGNSDAALEISKKLELPDHVQKMLHQPPDRYVSTNMGKFYNVAMLPSDSST